MRVVLDTDIAIDFLRGVEPARKLFNKFSLHSLACSAVTVAELWAGASIESQESVQNLLNVFQIIPVDGKVAQQAGDYLRHFSKSHGIGLPDALIAATAHYIRVPLITRNIRHFPMDDIQIVKPY